MCKNKDIFDLMIKRYNTEKNITITKMLNEYGLCKSSFYRYLRINKIELPKKICRNYEISEKYQKLADIYKNNPISINKLCDEEHISHKSFSIYLKKNNIPVRKTYIYKNYVYDKDYFENIDTEHKAYWLGFIFADGSITYRKGVHKLTIEISNVDLSHLKKFNNDLNSNLKIIKRKNRDTSYINITSKKLAEDLIKLGAVVNKTVNGYFSNDILNLSDNLKIAFCRGYFDGDGFIDKKRNRVVFTIKSEIITNSLKDFLSKYNFKSKKDHNYYRLYVENRKDFISFLNDIYKDASIYLDRKYNIYLNRCAPPDSTVIEDQDEQRGNSKEA